MADSGAPIVPEEVPPTHVVAIHDHSTHEHEESINNTSRFPVFQCIMRLYHRICGTPTDPEEVPPIHEHSEHEKSINKMSRFPVSMREFCQEQNYIIPKAVAIGPYHRGLSQLQEMEEIKEAAAHFFFQGTDLQESKSKVFPIALNARETCYNANEVKGISDDTFASMMFHDACFLLLTILAITEPIKCVSSLLRKIGANRNVLLRDIFLLENQIPWVVLQPLIAETDVKLDKFIAAMGIQSHLHHNESHQLNFGQYKPPHLLAVFHFYQAGHGFTCRAPETYTLPETCLSSAIELAEIGIKLTRSKTEDTTKLKDIGLTKRVVFPKLFLPSLNLNERSACWLLNMAAFETCTASHDCTVSSYLALFAMLMDREEDVHELRSKHLIHGEFTNKQVLDFFKGRQASNICPGNKFYEILRSIEMYRHTRYIVIWITIHRFLYNHIKTIVTIVLPIVGLTVAIFFQSISKRR